MIDKGHTEKKGSLRGRKDELNTGHEVFGQWPVDSLFQRLFLTFLCFLSKKCMT